MSALLGALLALWLAAFAPQPTPPPLAVSPTLTVSDSPTVTLAAVGDLMMARSIGRALQRSPADTPLADVADALRAADVTVGNLECALGVAGRPAAKSYTFRGPPTAANALRDAGFDVVTLANNHSLDYGEAAQAETLALLDAAGIAHVGSGHDEAAAYAPAFIEARGLRLAFLGYVNVPVEFNGFDTARWRAVGGRPGLAWAEPARIAADVAAARAQADLVIVLLHAGYEGRAAPNAVQRANAYAAIDAGAALVLGAHPHVLQGVEQYHGGWIVYSLGNFVFDGFTGVSNESAILFVTLSRDGVEALAWTPVVIRNGRPHPATGSTAAAIRQRIERLSAALIPQR
jgi:poly-gamma-glutamate capsule biosynthesis protein CapA/YwtB (metallophosphatase superfamily)